jgi:hypothetical protein
VPVRRAGEARAAVGQARAAQTAQAGEDIGKS